MPALTPRDPASSHPSLALRSTLSSISSYISDHLTTRQTSNSQSPNSNLDERAIQGIIPTYYRFDGPAPGTVAGIVLGSVAGFMLLVWLLFSLTNQGGGAAIAGEEEIVVRRRPTRSRSPHSRRSRRSSHPEVREYAGSRSPRSREHVIVEERRGPPPMRARSRSVIVEERGRVPGDDVVEVIEEHDDYVSRRGSRRSGSSYRRY